jgi:hypothetical protein
MSHCDEPDAGRLGMLDRLDAKRVLVLWRLATEQVRVAPC